MVVSIIFPWGFFFIVFLLLLSRVFRGFFSPGVWRRSVSLFRFLLLCFIDFSSDGESVVVDVGSGSGEGEGNSSTFVYSCVFFLQILLTLNINSCKFGIGNTYSEHL